MLAEEKTDAATTERVAVILRRHLNERFDGIVSFGEIMSVIRRNYNESLQIYNEYLHIYIELKDNVPINQDLSLTDGLGKRAQPELAEIGYLKPPEISWIHSSQWNTFMEKYDELN